MALVETFPKNPPIRLKGKKMRKLRQQCYDRAEGCCELCARPAPWEGPVFYRGHMAHIKSKGAGGSDTLENVEWRCGYSCHLEKDHSPRWTKGRAVI